MILRWRLTHHSPFPHRYGLARGRVGSSASLGVADSSVVQLAAQLLYRLNEQEHAKCKKVKLSAVLISKAS
jgi:hypothetical protein